MNAEREHARKEEEPTARRAGAIVAAGTKRVHQYPRDDIAAAEANAESPVMTGDPVLVNAQDDPLAIERMQIGLLARGQVSVSSFVEEGNRVLAHVHHIGEDVEAEEDGIRRAERFVVAEVQDGLIVGMSGYSAEDEARAALSVDASRERPAGEER